MPFINSILGVPLGYVMYLCYRLSGSYGLSIILFTLVSKLILLPVAVMVQKNGISMVKLQPELNAVKERYAGDRDRIAEEQLKIYQQEHYSPALGCLPMLLQLPLVLGLISVIYNPMQHMLHLDAGLIAQLTAQAAALLGTDSLGSAPQLAVLRLLSDPATAAGFSGFTPQLLEQLTSLDAPFLGLQLSAIPSIASPSALVPLLAGLSAWLLCAVQNRQNVLQREQSRLSQIGMTLFMIAFSAYFAFIVPCGVGLYWICGNLFAVPQLLLLNRLYDPRKYIDYASRPQPLTKEQQQAQKAAAAALRAREKADTSRFFAVDNWRKELVVYSEKSGFYKYFSDILAYILDSTDIVIHYVTGDPDDQVFARASDRLIPYYVSNERLASFFLKIDADVLLMTMPDLGQFHIKRSMARKDIEYVYCFHYPLSTHMVLRRRALADYDTILMVGEFQRQEIRQAERLDGTKEKRLICCGYGLLEQLDRRYRAMPRLEREHKKLLIAPSWQPQNILDSCIRPMLDALLGKGYEVVVRPHPEYVKRYAPRMDALVAEYADYQGGDLRFELDFSADDSLYDSDLVISDWSGTAYEFAFITKKPVLFVDTPPKINNEDYQLLTVEPLEIALRDQIGLRVSPDDMQSVPDLVQGLLSQSDAYQASIQAILDRTIANFGHSGEIGGAYIAKQVYGKRGTLGR